MVEMTGIIDHRILLNYRIDPDVLQRQMPREFKVNLVNGYGIGGICQVSLSNMRPKNLPLIPGIKSHNTAHRVAVVGPKGEGVYVFRRDTNSTLNQWSGGRLFPGKHYKADFDVSIAGEAYKVEVKDKQGDRLMCVEARVVEEMPAGSIFQNVTEVSEFFKKGNLGWSKDPDKDHYDAIELKTTGWTMDPMAVVREYSGFFSDPARFPAGSVEFDSAVIMRDLEHSWISREGLNQICC